MIEILITFLCSILIIIIYIVAKRKNLESTQRRNGPNVTGFWGTLQAFADGLKLILKEVVIPMRANWVFFRSNLNILLKKFFFNKKTFAEYLLYSAFLSVFGFFRSDKLIISKDVEHSKIIQYKEFLLIMFLVFVLMCLKLIIISKFNLSSIKALTNMSAIITFMFFLLLAFIEISATLINIPNLSLFFSKTEHFFCFPLFFFIQSRFSIINFKQDELFYVSRGFAFFLPALTVGALIDTSIIWPFLLWNIIAFLPTILVEERSDITEFDKKIASFIIFILTLPHILLTAYIILINFTTSYNFNLNMWDPKKFAALLNSKDIHMWIGTLTGTATCKIAWEAYQNQIQNQPSSVRAARQSSPAVSDLPVQFGHKTPSIVVPTPIDALEENSQLWTHHLLLVTCLQKKRLAALIAQEMSDKITAPTEEKGNSNKNK